MLKILIITAAGYGETLRGHIENVFKQTYPVDSPHVDFCMLKNNLNKIEI